MKNKFFLFFVFLTLFLLIFPCSLSAKKDISEVKKENIFKIEPASHPEESYLKKHLLTSPKPHSFSGEIQSPYDTILGYTYYELQHSATMSQMIANDYSGGQHFTWMNWPATPPSNRYVDYIYHSPTCSFSGGHITEGGKMGGYTGLNILSDSRAVLCHHYTIAEPGQGSRNTVIAIDSAVGACVFREYDVPDSTDQFIMAESGMWPRCAIDSLNRIHICGLEGKTSSGPAAIVYTRCEQIPGTDSLLCVAPGVDTIRIAPGDYLPDSLNLVAYLDLSAVESYFIATSPVSRKVAIAYTKWTENWPVPDDTSLYTVAADVWYIESTNGGDDWIQAGTFDNVQKNNLTNYQPDDSMRTYVDLYAIYDYNDNLHIFWNAHYMKELTDEYDPHKVILYHWSQPTETPCGKFQVVARAFWDAIPGVFNRNISKMTAGVGYLPENYNHLYLVWTQFNPNDLSAGGYTNGELYASVSTNSGLTWSDTVNITNTPDSGCVAGECNSDHWASIAYRVDTLIHILYVNDKDAGTSLQDEGTHTENPILYYRHPVWVPSSIARIDWSPKKYFLNLPNYGIFDTDLLIYNIGTETLTGTVTAGASWIQITDGTFNITEGPCPHIVEVRFDCSSYAETLLVDSILISSNAETNDSVYVPAKLIVSDEYIEPQFVLESNYTFGIYESNVGNIGHQEEVGGMYFYEDDFAPLFDGSVIIGAYVDSPKVGRYIFEEKFMLAETELNLVDKPGVKTKIAKSKFYPVNPFPPESWDFWGWTVKMYDKIFYSGENNSPERFVKKVHLKIYKNPEPSWWSEDPNPDNLSVLVGMAIDFDLPSDTGNYWNLPGYDEDLNLLYQQGYSIHNSLTAGGNRLDSLYAGIADRSDNSSYGAHILPNDVYVYPQSGYRDDSLYAVMSTPGFSVRDPKAPPQRTVDYNCVMTHDSIPGNLGDGDTVEVQFLIVVSTTGLKDLKDKVKMFRCGNADRDSAGQINLSDIISMAKDCFGSGDETFRYLADVNGDCQLNLTDVITLANYIFGKLVEIHCDCGQN